MTPNINRLIEIMARLRDPESGCPWDIKQDFSTIAPYTIEEAYEVADAIERQDLSALREELGDLLLQVVYHARMAEEIGAFGFDDVAQAISDKMVSRHPHVFGSAEVENAATQTIAWEEQKARERRAKAAANGEQASVLDDLPVALPALTRAEKLQKRAARVGFDWPDALPVLDKVAEEIGELRAELDSNGAQENIADEIGDMLFTCVNLARHLRVEPEDALRRCNAKFERRFRHIESTLAAADRSPESTGLDEMERLWQQAKQQEGKAPGE